MKKLLDILAKIIIVGVFGAVVVLIGTVFYQMPQIILPIVCGLVGVVAFVWALNRVEAL